VNSQCKTYVQIKERDQIQEKDQFKEITMPYVGDDYLTVKEYRDLRAKYRAAMTTQPWQKWAVHYLSPAGARDRELVQARERYETQNRTQIWAGIQAQREAMDREVEPVHDPEVVRLRELANQRDETGGYSLAALRAQRQLDARGIHPTSRRS
jgi:hypothetical protein